MTWNEKKYDELKVEYVREDGKVVVEPLALDEEQDRVVKQFISKQVEDTAQQAYLECLAVECGEGECARAIRTKLLKHQKSDS